MFFEALVIDTDTFFERGTIVVRIPAVFFKTMQWDLTENYPDFMNDGFDGEKHSYDFEAYVYSPYGGGSNFGTLFLPQVNQKGIVVSMDTHLRKLVWLGSFFQPTRNDSWEVEKVNYPSDDMNQEGETGYGSLNGEQNLLADSIEEAKQKNFIARFKTTDKSTIEGLTWEDRPTSNIISIGDNSFFVTHFSKDSGWEEKVPKLWTTYSMSKDEDGNDITELKRTDVNNEKEQRLALAFIDSKESFITEIKNDKDEKYSTILQQEDIVKLEVKEKDTVGSIELTKDGFNINLDQEGDIYSFKISPLDGEMRIVVNNDHEISLDKDGKLSIDLGDEIDISSGGDITIEPGGIVKIGSSGFSALARYDELKKILDKLEKHIHVAPTGPTTAPLESSMSPISPGIMQDKRKMETKTVEAE